ncbi:MAG: ComEC/Rec2 family competence protein, partial [Synechococcaceae cyanobacterium RM1_1_27]|nr:ComEC/Rec2 family competence protein [Synechococcaceae cyanobacterium RM1_1_27]
LSFYMLMTGFSPPVVRAALMGAASAVLLVDPKLQGRIRLQPAGVLLAVAVLLLIFNPNWIGNLSFQLSFMATLGLMVGIQPLQKRLDWLPPGLALPIAISLSAQVWTLPLQLYVFGSFSTYSLVANLLTLPLIIVLCTVGFWGLWGGFAQSSLGIPGGPAARAVADAIDQLGSLDRHMAGIPGLYGCHQFAAVLVVVWGIVGAGVLAGVAQSGERVGHSGGGSGDLRGSSSLATTSAPNGLGRRWIPGAGGANP